MKPGAILLFMAVVLAALAVIGWAVPDEGIRIGDQITLRFPSPASVLFPVEQEKVDISEILALPTDPMDTATTEVPKEAAPTEDVTQALAKDAATEMAERSALIHPDGQEDVLFPFFDALERAKKGKRPIRVLHYGDSQLEGDRITAYLRNKLQSHFGGHGPGMVSVADIVTNFSVDRVLEGDWKRYSVMGRKDSTLNHARFGALSSFSRFTPVLPDSVAPDTTEYEASISLKPTRRSYARARGWTVCRMYYGWHRAAITLEMRSGEELVSTEVIPPSEKLLTREWRFPATPEQITITLRGADSPDVYAISLEGPSGVVVDNIAARGAAGYEFRKADQGLLKAMYQDLNVKLMVLQYGGNVLPYMKSAEEAEQYGRAFGAQIKRFKQMIPGVNIVVIGPSDMSIKEGEFYVTRPFLEEVRDAMKANTLAQGAVFWDMYEAMGGRNSMVSWVEADPPLAAPDYTHFSPAGAHKIGELFFHALIADHARYRSLQGTTDATP